ncbi:hypothetical protein MPER_13110 [Moniliophthora perniciosa FA553]|nr:hypothetical protein MPER_13110 [Moniliophthora perniciosa FA553]
MYPPVPKEVLRANRLPSEYEIARTRRAIIVEERELERYQTASVRLGAPGAVTLMAKWADLKRRIEARRSWLSPVRRLPPEILEAIFSLCVPAACSLIVADSGRHITSPPSILSRVSAYWRAVVTSRPTLWSSISVEVYQLERDISSLLVAHLANSKQSHLRIQIMDSNQDNVADLRDLGNPLAYLGCNGYRALQILLHHLTRCRELDLRIDSDILNAIGTSSILNVSFPYLRSFHDNTITWTIRPASFWFWESIRNAPMLTELVTSSAEVRHKFPCHQLTIVSFGHITLAQLRDFLSISLKLRSLTVHILNYGNGEDHGISTMSQSVTLPYLRIILFTRCHSLNKLSSLFNSITLPSLTQLSLMEDCRSIQEPWDITAFLSLLARSSCLLRELAIHFWGSLMPPDSMADILQATPELESLMLISNRDVVHASPCFDIFMDDLLARLVIEPGKPMLVPRLLRLHVEGSSGVAPPVLTSERMNILARMARSRSKAEIVAKGLRNLVSSLDILRLSLDTHGHAVVLGPGVVSLQVLP